MKILGVPNYTAQDYVVADASLAFQPAEMEVSYLKTDEPSDRGRITILDPYHSQVGFTTSLVPLTIQGIAAVNHNIELGGQIRFTGWGGSVVGGRLLPTISPPQTVVSSANMTGVVGNVDESIDAPDGLSMAPTTVTDPWSVTLRFFTLTGTVDPAADRMCLVVRVRRVFTGAGADDPVSLPKCTASLAAPSFALGYRAVTKSTTGGQIFIFPFKRADFTSLSDLQATLAFTPGGSLSGGQYAVLETAAVYYEKIDLNTPTFDSGWISVPGDARAAPVLPIKNLHYFPPTPWTNVISYGVMFRSDQAVHNPLLGITSLLPAGVVADPVTFVQAGVAPAGGVIEPSRGIRKGSTPIASVEALGFGGATAGGQSYAADSYRLRRTEPMDVLVTRDEEILLREQLAYRRGVAGPVYIALEPDVDLSYQTFTSMWGTLVRMGPSVPAGRYRADGQMLFLTSLEFAEKL